MRTYVIADNSKLHLFYYEFVSGMGQWHADLYYKNRDLGSSSWSSSTLIEDFSDPNTTPVDISLSNDGKLNIVYSDGVFDLYYKKRNTSWSSAYNFGEGRNQKVCANSNDIYIVWIDDSDDELRLKQKDYTPLAPQNLQVSTPYLDHPVLTWSANQEADLDKYYIYRYNDELGWVNIGNTSNTTYTDEGVTCGIPDHQFTYKIKAKDKAGNYSNYSNTTTAFYGAYKIAGDNTDENTVTHYSLDQNYPNPFNPSTQIKFNIKEESFVDLSVFDLNGQLVKSLVNRYLEPGSYAVNFDGSQLASGIYIYKISAGSFSQIKRMLLIK